MRRLCIDSWTVFQALSDIPVCPEYSSVTLPGQQANHILAYRRAQKFCVVSGMILSECTRFWN